MIVLTPKREKFAQSIAHKEFDYTWLAYEAHYSTSGMKRDTIYQESCRILADSKVSARVKEIEQEIVSKSIISLNEVLETLSNRAKFDVRDCFDENGAFKHPKDLTFEQGQAISSFNVNELWGKGIDGERMPVGEVKNIKFTDLEKVLESFMKKYGQYVITHKHLLDRDEEYDSAIEEITKDIKG